MSKRKNLAAAIILVITMATAVISSAGCGTKDESDIQTGTNEKTICNSVKEFKEKSSKGEKCVLRTSDIEGACTKADLVYDGEKFFVEGEEDEKYSHIVELEGRKRNAEDDTYTVVLANEEYSWEDYMWLENRNQVFDSEGNAIYDPNDEREWTFVTKLIIIR